MTIETPKLDLLYDQIKHEMARAINKFPTWPTNPVVAAAVVAEESGELVKASLQACFEKHKSAPTDVRAEAIETAAMAFRFLLSLDAQAYAFEPTEQHVQEL